MQRATARSELGREGEEAALRYYRSRGYQLLARNWTCRVGELDLVLARGSTVVFCEVKARTATTFGGPHEAVHHRKQRKLRLVAEAFLVATEIACEDVRFDVASVTMASATPSVHVFESAF